MNRKIYNIEAVEKAIRRSQPKPVTRKAVKRITPKSSDRELKEYLRVHSPEYFSMWENGDFRTLREAVVQSGAFH
jgi:hypothetical protein